MPAFNPGTLESLVGVTFPAGSLIDYYATADYTTADPLAGNISFTSDYITNVNTNSFTVTAVNSAYTAPFYYLSTTYFATFGSITLENQFGGSVTLFIHGVSENGLWLHNTKDLPASAAYGNGLATLTNAANPTFPLDFTYDASVYVAPCFVEGTRILTARGAVAVEDLVEGDEAVTAGGATRPVIWIGSRRVRCDRHPRPAQVQPIRVRAGAFGEGLPAADLCLSPGHSVHVDGVLVPVGLLANGATIVQEAVEQVRYFHVELDAHDIVLAEGLACESYLDDGNRQVFGNAPGHLALYGRLDPQDWDQACAPVLREGEALAALRARLADRAQALGWTLSVEPALSLEADGVTVAPVLATDGRAWFIAPAARRLVLRSPVAVPALATPGHPDRRSLGVALAGLRIGSQVIDLASDALDRGFHGLEVRPADGQAWRWTDGAAELPATAAPTMVEVAVSMVSPRWVAPDQALNQASPIAPRLRLVEAG